MAWGVISGPTLLQFDNVKCKIASIMNTEFRNNASSTAFDSIARICFSCGELYKQAINTTFNLATQGKSPGSLCPNALCPSNQKGSFGHGNDEFISTTSNPNTITNGGQLSRLRNTLSPNHEARMAPEARRQTRVLKNLLPFQGGHDTARLTLEHAVEQAMKETGELCGLSLV